MIKMLIKPDYDLESKIVVGYHHRFIPITRRLSEMDYLEREIHKQETYLAKGDEKCSK
jgi:hypothetical protein